MGNVRAGASDDSICVFFPRAGFGGRYYNFWFARFLDLFLAPLVHETCFWYKREFLSAIVKVIYRGHGSRNESLSITERLIDPVTMAVTRVLPR